MQNVDVVVIAVPLTEFEDAVSSLPIEALRGKLVVGTSSLMSHPKSVLLRSFGNLPDIDLLTTHPMMGPPPTTNTNTLAAKRMMMRMMIHSS
jgi:prephenate dehydrogenase